MKLSTVVLYVYIAFCVAVGVVVVVRPQTIESWWFIVGLAVFAVLLWLNLRRGRGETE